MADLVNRAISHRMEHHTSKGTLLSMVTTYEGTMSMAQVWNERREQVHETSLFSGQDHAEFAHSCACDWVLYESDKV